MWTNNNILTLTDSYKFSHWKQYPKGTQTVYSYLESRGGKFQETVFFGLQYFLKEYLEGEVITKEKIDEAEALVNDHMGPVFNREGWDYILEKYNGKLPIKIKALPEGMVVPVGTPLVTVENTDANVPWLTNFLESLLLQVWYPITVATLSRECKKIIKDGLMKTTDYLEFDEFEFNLSLKLVDFGFRGTSSPESAALGGAANMINFIGSDTFTAVKFIKHYYNFDGMPGFSIPASEHSTITSWGKENEIKAYENMLDQYKDGPVACVSDSFDITNAVENLWPELKDKIESRDGVLIVRPDSGDIKATLQVVLSALWKNFGGRLVDGYKIINPKVRVIQGDGMNYESLKDTVEYIMSIGYSIDNIAFGMGGALLQKVNRDTQKFAFKCSAIKVDGQWKDVFKAPTEIDENGNKRASFKKSKLGRFKVINGPQSVQTVPYDPFDIKDNLLQTVFENGVIKRECNFLDVKRRARVL